MFRATLFVIAKKRKSKCPPTDKWTKCGILTQQNYYLSINMNEVLIHVTKWVDLENIMLCEKSQTPKATYYMNPFICNVQNRKIHRV